MIKHIFGRSRSTRPTSVVCLTKSNIEAFGENKFQDLCRTHGEEHAVKEVENFFRNNTSDERSESSTERLEREDSEKGFGVEDTDVWFTEDSVECVLGAF